ncbi:MAG: hypothetical protein R3A51_14720 [Nannocystaceae bacterium]
MQTSELFRVELRAATLTTEATLTDPLAGGERFLAIDRPPPVGSILTVTGESGAPLVLEVRRVELAEARGCVCAEVEDARLGELELVGSEHLEPMPLVRSPLAVVAAVGELPAIEDDEPSVTVIVPLTAKVPLAAGGGKLRKGRTRA